MRMMQRCPSCGGELFFEKKDIKPLSQKEKRSYEKLITEISTSKDTLEWLRKEVGLPFAKIKCFCGKEFLIIKVED